MLERELAPGRVFILLRLVAHTLLIGIVCFSLCGGGSGLSFL